MIYVNEVNKIVEETIAQYAIQIYINEKLNQILCNKIQFSVWDQTLIEVLFMLIRGQTIYERMKQNHISERKNIRRKYKLNWK